MNLITGLFVALSCGALALGCGMGAFIARRAAHERAIARQLSAAELAPLAEPSLPRPECWLAIRSRDLNAVQHALGLQNTRTCSFAEALTGEQSIFIAPPVNGWIIVTGSDLPEPSEDVDACFRFVVRLSRTLGHVQFFHASDISNRHGWIKADRGRIVRAYVCADTPQWVQGTVTSEERELGLASYPYGTDPEDMDPDDTARNSERVPALASRWSIDPARIDPQFLETRQGIAGECSS